jgi:hypothetical protein
LRAQLREGEELRQYFTFRVIQALSDLDEARTSSIYLVPLQPVGRKLVSEEDAETQPQQQWPSAALHLDEGTARGRQKPEASLKPLHFWVLENAR